MARRRGGGGGIQLGLPGIGGGGGGGTSGPAAGSLGSLMVELGLDPTALLNGLKAVERRFNNFLGTVPGGVGEGAPARQIEKMVQGFGRNFAATGRDLAGIGFRMTMVFAPVMLAVKESITAFAEYETEVTKIQNLTSATAAMTKKWSQDFLTLGPALGRTPTELARGMYFIAGAGIVGNTAMELLTASTKASVIGLGEVEHVAKLGAAAVNAYGKENLSASDAVDMLAAAVLYGNVETDSLAQSMGRVIPIAATVGAKFYDIAAAIAVATRTGANADQVVTGLRGLLNILAAPAKESQKLLRSTAEPNALWANQSEGAVVEFSKRGLSTERMRSILKDYGMPALLETIKAAFKDNMEYLDQLIPNIRALTHYTSLAGEQAENFKAIWEEIRNSAGLVDAAFLRTQTTVAYTMAVFRAQLEASAIQVTQNFQPTIRAVLSSGTTLVWVFEKITNVLGYLSTPIHAVIAGLIGVVATMGPLLFLFGAFNEVMGKTLFQFSKVAIVGAAMRFPLGGWQGMLVALGATLMIFTGQIIRAQMQAEKFKDLALVLTPSMDIKREIATQKIADIEHLVNVATGPSGWQRLLYSRQLKELAQPEETELKKLFGVIPILVQKNDTAFTQLWKAWTTFRPEELMSKMPTPEPFSSAEEALRGDKDFWARFRATQEGAKFPMWKEEPPPPPSRIVRALGPKAAPQLSLEDRANFMNWYNQEMVPRLESLGEQVQTAGRGAQNIFQKIGTGLADVLVSPETIEEVVRKGEESRNKYLTILRNIDKAKEKTLFPEEIEQYIIELTKWGDSLEKQPTAAADALREAGEKIRGLRILREAGLKVGIDWGEAASKILTEGMTKAASVEGFNPETAQVRAMEDMRQRSILYYQRPAMMMETSKRWEEESKNVTNAAEAMQKLGFTEAEVLQTRREALELHRLSIEAAMRSAQQQVAQMEQYTLLEDVNMSKLNTEVLQLSYNLEDVRRSRAALDFTEIINKSVLALQQLELGLAGAQNTLSRLEGVATLNKRLGESRGVLLGDLQNTVNQRYNIIQMELRKEEQIRKPIEEHQKFLRSIMPSESSWEEPKLNAEDLKAYNDSLQRTQFLFGQLADLNGEFGADTREINAKAMGPMVESAQKAVALFGDQADKYRDLIQNSDILGASEEKRAKWREMVHQNILKQLGQEQAAAAGVLGQKATQFVPGGIEMQSATVEYMDAILRAQNAIAAENRRYIAEQAQVAFDALKRELEGLDKLQEGYKTINGLLEDRSGLMEKNGATQLQLIAFAERMDQIDRAQLLFRKQSIERELKWYDERPELTGAMQARVRELQGEWIGVNAELDLGVTRIEKMNQSFLNLGETISGVFEDVIMGLAMGTGKFEDAGKNLGKALIGEFIKSAFADKKLFDIQMERNLLSYIPGLGFLGGQKTGENLGRATLANADKYLSGLDTLFSSTAMGQMPQGKGMGFIPQIEGLAPGFAKAAGDIQAAGKSIAGGISTAGESTVKAIGGTGTASAAQLAAKAAFSAKLSAGLAIGGTAAVLGNSIAKGVDAMQDASNKWGMTATEIRRQGAESFMTSTGVPHGIAKYLAKVPALGMGLTGGLAGALGGGLTAAALAAGHLGGFVGPMGGLMGIGFGAMAGGLIGIAVGAIAAIVMQFLAHIKTTETLIRKNFYKVTQALGYPAMTFEGVSGKQNLNLRMPGSRGGPTTQWPAEYDKYVQGIAYAAGAVYGSNIKGKVGRGAYDPNMIKNAILNNAVAMRLGAEDAEKYALAVIKSTAGAEDLNKALLRLQAVSYLPRYAQNMGINTANRLQQTRTIAGELIYAFEDLPKAINSAELATVAFTDRGILELEKFKRALDDAKSAITEGLKSALMVLVDTRSTFLAGQALGKAFADAFNERITERVLNDEILGIFLTKASVTFTEAAQALAKGDMTLFEQLRGEAMDYFKTGRAQALDFFTKIAPGIREVQYGLGFTTPGGWVNQTGLGLPQAAGGMLIPGPRTMGRLIVAHGGEEVISAADRGSLLSQVEDVRSLLLQRASRTGGGDAVVVESRVFLDGRELDRGLTYAATRQRTRLNNPKSRIGVR